MSYRKYMQAYNAHTQQLQKHCKKHLNKHVKCHMIDGQVYEGYLEHVDKKNLYVIIEVEYKPPKPIQQGPSPGAGQQSMSPTMNPYRPYSENPYPQPYPRFTYRRLILPLPYLTAISLVPF